MMHVHVDPAPLGWEGILTLVLVAVVVVLVMSQSTYMPASLATFEATPCDGVATLGC